MSAARVVIVTVALLAAVGLYLFSYPKPAVDPAWKLPAVTSAPEGSITVRFSGTTTLLFSDGETSWMVDGWFTRPGPLKTLFGSIEPDREAISFGLEQNRVDELAAVIPIHSHYDHAMDSPEVAMRTGAMLIGSNASANIGRGWGMPEDRIRVVADGEEITLGQFSITFIESRHLQYPNEEMVERLITQSEIPEPLVPPATIYDYKLGKAYVLHVRHPAGSFMVIGSAGFVPGQLSGIDVDLLFLGVGGLGAQTRGYRDQYWFETVEAVSPQRIVLTHWDSLTAPLNGPFVGEVRLAGILASGESETLAYLKSKEVDNPQLALHTLPRFVQVQILP